MSKLQSQVILAQRRLNANILMHHLGRALLVAACAFTIGLLIVRTFSLGLSPFYLLIPTLALLLGLALNGLLRERYDTLAAAVVLDQAAGLKERISTALSIQGSPDPFARAAIRDAEEKVARVHVPAHVRYRATRVWPWSLATTLAAAILAAFLPDMNLFAHEKPAQSAYSRAQLEAERQAVEIELRKRADAIQDLGTSSKSLAALKEQLDPSDLPDDPTATPEDIRREAIKKIDHVNKRLQAEKAAQKLAALDEMKRMLGQLDAQKGDSPAAELSQALASADFEKARKALSDLQQKLDAAANSDDPEARKQAAQMQQQLQRLADQVDKLDNSQRMQKELENKAGLSEQQAQELLDKLEGKEGSDLEETLQKELADSGLSQDQIKTLAQKLAQQKDAQQKCRQLAEQLGKACQQCQQGGQQQGNQPGKQGGQSGQQQNPNAQGANQNPIQQADGMLSELEASQQLLDELDAQISELDQLRDDLAQAPPPPAFNQPRRKDGPIGRGPGQGEGLGRGARPEGQRAAHRMNTSKVKAPQNQGRIIGQMLVDGPQAKGESLAEARNAVAAATRDAEEAIEREDVPRQYDRVLRAYFERLAGLVGNAENTEDSPENAPDATGNVEQHGDQ